MFELRGYIDETGKKGFAMWFEGLDAIAAARVTIALTRIDIAAAQVCWADYKRRKKHAPYP